MDPSSFIALCGDQSNKKMAKEHKVTGNKATSQKSWNDGKKKAITLSKETLTAAKGNLMILNSFI